MEKRSQEKISYYYWYRKVFNEKEGKDYETGCDLW